MPRRLIEPAATSDQVREIPIPGDEFLIGRGADCDLRLRGSEISRHHCLFHIGKEEATVNDLGSANGTLLNGQPIRCPTAVKSGDEIRLGTFRFIVDLGDDPEIFKWMEGTGDPTGVTLRIPKGHRKPADNKDKA